jgi:hypothetical protein
MLKNKKNISGIFAGFVLSNGILPEPKWAVNYSQ